MRSLSAFSSFSRQPRCGSPLPSDGRGRELDLFDLRAVAKSPFILTNQMNGYTDIRLSPDCY
jgi:hypothetical protein